MTDFALAPSGLLGSGPHKAWYVAGTTCLALLASAAAVGVPNLLILPLEREFGWNVATISSALAVRLGAYGLAGVLSSPLTRVLGVRAVACLGLATASVGLLGTTVVSQPWQLIVCWGVLVGSGSGMVAIVLGATVATRWFSARRGLVIGLFGAATTAGQMLMLVPLELLADGYGWRASLLVPCGLAVSAAAATYAFVPEWPRDVGLRAYGAEHGEPIGRNVRTEAGTALAEILRSGLFWTLLGSLAICGATTAGLVQTHLVSLCSDLGVGPLPAAGFLAWMGLLSLVGSTSAGWLSDRFDAGGLLFWFYSVRGLSLVCLPFTDISFVGLSMFATIYGLDWAATVPPTAKLLLSRFGRERAPFVLGLVSVGHQLGAAAAAYGAGLSRLGLESYLPSFILAGALCLLVASIIPMACRNVQDREIGGGDEWSDDQAPSAV